MPPTVESGFDSLTQVGLKKIGMNPEFIADYVNYEVMKNAYDFTDVTKTFRTNVVDTAGKHASKKAFEEAGKVVDRGIEVVAGVLGATGQWYGTATAILGEEALDWAESKFEHWMGWDEEDLPIKGHWVLIDEGTTRRRLPGLLQDETSAKSPLVRAMTPAYANGSVDHGYVHLVTLGMEERNAPAPSLLRMTSEMEAKMNDSKAGKRILDMIAHHPHGLHRPVVDQVKGKVGQLVKIDGDLWTVVQGTSIQNVEAERDGRHVSRPWGDPSVQAAWNANNGASTFRSGPADWLQDDFVQSGEFHRGEWVWWGKELNVIVAVESKDSVNLWSAANSESWPQRADPDDLEHFDGGEQLPSLFNEFRAFALDGYRRQAESRLPFKKYPTLVSQRGAVRPEGKFVPRQQRGKPETTWKPAGETVSYPTDALARRIDEQRERYNKAAAANPELGPPEKYPTTTMDWDTASTESWGAPQWNRKNPPETAGVNFLPIALLGLGAAFALTR